MCNYGLHKWPVPSQKELWWGWGMGIVESSQMYICLSCLQMAAQLYSTTNCKYNTYVSLLGVDTI